MKPAKKLFPHESGYLGTIDTGNLECPYCHASLEAEYDDRDGWSADDTEFETESECPVCGCEFNLTCEAVVEYGSRAIECEGDNVQLG